MNRIYAAPILLAVTLGAGAQPSTNAVASPDQSRPVSLKDCIQLALTHNFDVRIQRFNPVIEFNALRADYGGYDPSLTVSGKASHNNVGQWTQVTSTNGVSSYVVVPQISDVDAFNSAVGGSTPWGLQYNLSGDVAQTEFNSPGSPASENASGQIGASVTQPLLKNFWIDTTRMTIQVAKNRLRYSEQGLRLQLITTVAAVQTAYDELIYAQENV
jgi:HAE1 family hydrophobic/amphiphilic exporter-1